jgi:hypothetical protein
MTSRTELPDIAERFRSALDGCDRSGWGIQFQSFPRGSCGAVCEVFGRYLAERFGIYAMYVSGRGRIHRDLVSSHAWLEIDGMIVDITGDQFGRAKVVVTRDDSWFDRFKDLDRHALTVEDVSWWLTYCAQAYHDVLARLDGASPSSGPTPNPR